MRIRLIGELERPTRARRETSRAGSRVRISTKAKSCSARRESEGVVVPRMAVQEKAAGGKDPCFVSASDAGKRG